jgi:hypothetical protein
MITVLNLPSAIADFDGWTISPELDRLKALLAAQRQRDREQVAAMRDDIRAARNTIYTAFDTPTTTTANNNNPNRNLNTATEVVPDGVYRLDGKFYQVVTAADTGRRYAKVFNPLTKRFRKATGAIYRLRREHALTPSEAGDFGRLYHVCVFCSRTLTDDRSKGAGYGPVCAGKHNLPWGEDTALTYTDNPHCHPDHTHPDHDG